MGGFFLKLRIGTQLASLAVGPCSRLRLLPHATLALPALRLPISPPGRGGIFLKLRIGTQLASLRLGKVEARAGVEPAYVDLQSSA